uniref:Uncharacterized protein n=1 Tax=Helianthus annuus TaxID=4232 RepID=A0A251TTV7_HELAN
MLIIKIHLYIFFRSQPSPSPPPPPPPHLLSHPCFAAIHHRSAAARRHPTITVEHLKSQISIVVD